MGPALELLGEATTVHVAHTHREQALRLERSTNSCNVECHCKTNNGGRGEIFVLIILTLTLTITLILTSLIKKAGLIPLPQHWPSSHPNLSSEVRSVRKESKVPEADVEVLSEGVEVASVHAITAPKDGKGDLQENQIRLHSHARLGIALHHPTLKWVESQR